MKWILLLPFLLTGCSQTVYVGSGLRVENAKDHKFVRVNLGVYSSENTCYTELAKKPGFTEFYCWKEEVVR